MDCLHTELERLSVCCGAVDREELGNHCARCGDGTGFDTVCVECQASVECTECQQVRYTAEGLIDPRVEAGMKCAVCAYGG